MSDRPSAKSFVNGPNLLTALGLAAGFVALMLASQGEFAWAAGAVGVAAVLDSVDGLLARRLGLSGPFGSQLDSLADMVAFGAAPGLMLYLGVLEDLPVAGVGACLAFVLAGAWRLARFAAIEDSEHRFLGLPIPPAGLIAAVIAAAGPSPAVAVGLTVVLTVLMISEVPFPTITSLARRVVSRRRAHSEESALITEAHAGHTAPAGGAIPSRRRG